MQKKITEYRDPLRVAQFFGIDEIGLNLGTVEIRQDLIAGADGQAEWAARFARILRPLLAA